MGGECGEVTGRIPREEDLRAWTHEGESATRTHMNGQHRVAGCFEDHFLPIAFPVAQMMKFKAIATDFFVWPATFRDMSDSARV